MADQMTAASKLNIKYALSGKALDVLIGTSPKVNTDFAVEMFMNSSLADEMTRRGFHRFTLTNGSLAWSTEVCNGGFCNMVGPYPLHSKMPAPLGEPARATAVRRQEHEQTTHSKQGEGEEALRAQNNWITHNIDEGSGASGVSFITVRLTGHRREVHFSFGAEASVLQSCTWYIRLHNESTAPLEKTDADDTSCTLALSGLPDSAVTVHELQLPSGAELKISSTPVWDLSVADPKRVSCSYPALDQHLTTVLIPYAQEQLAREAARTLKELIHQYCGH